MTDGRFIAPRELTDMIEASPNLIELSLDTWGLVLDILRNLKNPLSKLRKLTLRGHHYTTYQHSRGYISPDHHPISLFLQIRPHIEELHLDWSDCVRCYRISDGFHPDIMLEAPQSLKRFSGPPILCAGLFKSPAAAQLESVIVKCRASHAAYFPKHRDATILMTETVESLPCLKELIFEDGVLPLYGIDYPQIGKILRAAPALVRAQLGCLELELVRRNFVNVD